MDKIHRKWHKTELLLPHKILWFSNITEVCNTEFHIMKSYLTYLITRFWFSKWLLTLLRNLLTDPNPKLATNKYGFALVRSVREEHPEDKVTSLRSNGKNSCGPTKWP
jgi:hypothetical protein